LQPTIALSERITRYLRNSSHMRLGIGRPHFSAYLPRVQDGNISVYRTDDMTDTDVRQLGSTYVGRPDAPMKGHCDLLASAIFDEGLNIQSAPHPHSRHANVIGWSIDSKNRLIAKKLSDKATLVSY